MEHKPGFLGEVVLMGKSSCPVCVLFSIILLSWAPLRSLDMYLPTRKIYITFSTAGWE